MTWCGGVVVRNDIQEIRSASLAVVAVLVLLLAGAASLLLLWTSGKGDQMFWFWPPALLIFFFLWTVFRQNLSGWVSPRVFLFASVPALVLLMSLHILVPYLPLSVSVSAQSSEAVDLSGEFLTVEGRHVSLDDYQGKLLFLNFWATWCGPCRQEMPSMAELYRELGDSGLSMVALTDEDPEIVQAYLENRPYPFPVLLDPEGTLFRRLKVRGLPTTLVLDEENRILLEHVGGYQWNTPDLMEKFRELLAE